MPQRPSTLRTDTGTGPADLVLVQSALRGEEGAIDAVLSRLGCCVRFVFRLNKTLGYGMPVEALEDVVQQVYAAVWTRLEDFAGTAALETWTFGFCRNCLRSEMRRRSQQLRLVSGGNSDEAMQQQLSDAPGPDEVATRMEGLDLLQEELDRLDPMDREIVVLRHLHEWSFERISETKGVAPSTIKDRCYRALDKIRFRVTRRHGRE